VGATACARHGCFIPHCIVDFQKGERQVLFNILIINRVDDKITSSHMNIDYSICNAIKHAGETIDNSLVIYDVVFILQNVLTTTIT